MATSISEISTWALKTFIQDKKYNLIDCRPMAAFNGWTLKGEKRGGHIPGAKSIPLDWTRYMDWIEVLEEKKISSDQPVIIYGYTAGETEKLANSLSDLGYETIWVYNHFVDEWSESENMPLHQLTRYRHLVHPEWVHQLVNGHPPDDIDGDNVVICHSHYGYPEDYDNGHIPGAVPLDTNSLESDDTWNRRSPAELADTLKSLGIRYDTTVVVYGRFSTPKFYEQSFPGKSAGHLGAIRCAAILLYAGVDDVRILNGGVTSWELAGYELSKSAVRPVPVDDFGRDIPTRPEFMIDTPEAKELLESPDGDLVSVRSWEEFIGESSGYHYIEKKGRIPGAVFGNCGSDAYHMENYRNFDHTMRDFHEVTEKWMEAGIVPDKKIAFYCGTGWRGSEAFMNAWLMGWPRVSVYDGGWFEWSSDARNPVETGPPADEIPGHAIKSRTG